jgi:hypothetical protein
VTGTSASLEASIDPHGAPTFYYFEYGLSEAYGSEVPALEGGDAHGAAVGSGEGFLRVGQLVTGLQAGREYHYRVVAVAELAPGDIESFPGPDHTFTTLPASTASGLADGRRWEQVSPVDKHGALIYTTADLRQGITEAAANGGAITYLSSGPIEVAPEGNADAVLQVFAQRQANGAWSSQDINTERAGAAPNVEGYTEYKAFSPDLAYALVEPLGPFTPLSGQEAAPIATESTVYRRSSLACDGPRECFRALVTSADDTAGTQFGGNGEQSDVSIVGSSSNLHQVILHSNVALTREAEGHGGLYEWSEGGASGEGSLRLVGIDESGPSAGATHLGNTSGEVTRNAVSTDGTLVAWTQDQPQHLYVTDTGTEESVRLDTVRGGSGAGTEAPAYETASADGTRVFFTDPQALTVGAEGGHPLGGTNLYMCQVTTTSGHVACELSDVAPGRAEVLDEVIGASDDGTFVYFVARGALTADAHAGEDNLYVAHESEGHWTTTFIGTLSSQDFPDWAGNTVNSIVKMTARISPDGEFLAFMSQQPLTGYDNRDLANGMPDEEVFIYDYATRRVLCASCNPTGERPTGFIQRSKEPRLVETQENWPDGTSIASNVPGWTTIDVGFAAHQPRYLGNGGRLFFDSNDALLPQDVNGTEDVYEYEPEGVGNCGPDAPGYQQRTGWCLGLISSGTSGDEAAVLDASENGEEVFFITSGALLEPNIEGTPSVYDARECSNASPCAASGNGVVPPACTSAESCRAAPTLQPQIYGAPTSATFSGLGNLTPAPVKAKVENKAEKLAGALHACRRDRSVGKRTVCERAARRAYDAKPKRAPKHRRRHSTKKRGR